MATVFQIVEHVLALVGLVTLIGLACASAWIWWMTTANDEPGGVRETTR